MTENGARTVDVHAHAVVPAAEALLGRYPGLADERQRDARWFGAAATEVNRDQLSQLGPLLTDVDRRLEAMDAARVDVQLVAPMPSSHEWTDADLADDYVVATNQGIAALTGVRPDRLIGVGTVALHHPDLAVHQLEQCVKELGLRGVQISSRAGEHELDAPALAGFWTRAEELGALVVIHPWGCSLGERLADYYLANTVGNPVETAVALSRLIFSGLLDRHPGLDIVSVHGGGYLPTYLGRSDHAWHARPDAHTCAHPPSSYLRRLWFDSLVYTPAGLRALVDAVGGDRVLLGSDYPFDMGVLDPLDRLEAAGLDTTDAVAIAGGNASRLLQRTDTEPATA
ncbi:amidohydrolase family protein [Streptomyces sp. NPDC090088]|uniref:amidohydrolase family protein n=1 Tax=Streptomyces sp. NPDC090088 TaxID=3365944 RepID=UPI003824FFF2